MTESKELKPLFAWVSRLDLPIDNRHLAEITLTGYAQKTLKDIVPLMMEEAMIRRRQLDFTIQIYKYTTVVNPEIYKNMWYVCVDHIADRLGLDKIETECCYDMFRYDDEIYSTTVKKNKIEELSLYISVPDTITRDQRLNPNQKNVFYIVTSTIDNRKSMR